jgi:hypothetical protein
VSVAGGDKLPVTIELKAQPAGTPAQPPPQTVVIQQPAPEPTKTPEQPPPPPPPTTSTSVWIAWGFTGALAAGAAVTGILALGNNSDLTTAKNDQASSSARLDELSDKAKTMALVSDILTVGAVAVGAFAIYLTVKKSGQQKSALQVGPTSVGYRVAF